MWGFWALLGLHFCASRERPSFQAPFGVPFQGLTWALVQARARFSPSSGPLIWTLFGYLFEPMLDPCSLVVRRQAASAAPFGVSMGPRSDLLCLLICLLPPGWRLCWLMGSFLGPFLLILRSHLLLVSSIFGVHVVLIWSFSRSIWSISFVHALHSKKELVSESFTSQVKMCLKYVTKTALEAQSSCRAKRGTYV